METRSGTECLRLLTLTGRLPCQQVMQGCPQAVDVSFRANTLFLDVLTRCIAWRSTQQAFGIIARIEMGRSQVDQEDRPVRATNEITRCDITDNEGITPLMQVFENG